MLRAYNLGRLVFVRPAAGTANPAVIVVTTRGQFFLKRRNPRYSSAGQMSFDHAVIRHLAQAGLPVVTPVRTISGSRWCTTDDGTYELYPLVTGEQPREGDLAQIAAAGRTLAAFHLATRDFTPPGEKKLGRLHAPAASLRGLKWARTHLPRDAASAPADLAAVDRAIRVAQAVAQRLPDEAYWGLPCCIIHGDYHPANLKVDGDKIAGVFDFDWVGRAPRMLDVADGLMFFCGTRAQPTVAGDIVSLTQAFRWETAALCAFGCGYAEQVTPTPRELQVLPDLLRARWLFCRVDAMERKLPAEGKLAYLLHELTQPLDEIDRLADWLAAGKWLVPEAHPPAEGPT